MNNIIEKVLKEVKDDQVNLASEAARRILAKKIADALLQEIDVRLASHDKLPKNWKL